MMYRERTNGSKTNLTNLPLGRYILYKLREINVNQVDAAKLGGFSRQSLRNWIQGNVKNIHLHHIVALANVLQISPYDLLQRVCRETGLEISRKPVSVFENDDVHFVSDLTYPDNSTIYAGSTFEKSWKIQNTGLTTWDDRLLVCVDSRNCLNNRLTPASSSVAIAQTLPGQTVDISVTLTAPNKPCTVRSVWQIQTSSGIACFSEDNTIWCQMRVEQF